jgi:uncharacterized protein (DUF4415 family)
VRRGACGAKWNAKSERVGAGEADAFIGTKLVRRGRPKAEKVKRAVSLRLDEDVIDWFKKGGPGWQTRMNDALRKAARV